MSLATFEQHPLIRYLRNPECLTTFGATDWERLLRSARRGYLSSRVAWLAKQLGLWSRLPEKIEFHLQSALRIADSQAVSVNWEVAQIRKALSREAIPFVLLKGAAYIKGRFDSGHGRLLSDVDIMVPRERLTAAEKALCEHGWFPTTLDAYDQRYYRDWMHELPPLQHLGRGTTIDVHHTIMPPTASLKPDVNKLWSRVHAVENEIGVFVLSPIDMVLHSSTHLFLEGELEHGLRDLVDIDSLIRQFSTQPQFFQELIARASELDLSDPLDHALRYCMSFIQTPIPEDIFPQLAEHGAHSLAKQNLADVFFLESVCSILQDQPTAKLRASQFAMYVRSHYLRMPMHLLIPHLIRKLLIGEPEANSA